MKKRIRKNTQLNLINPKRAGRPAKQDKGIRHIERPIFKKRTSFLLTIKVCENKADIKTKRILKALHHAIKRARLQKLKILHYTLEYNHVHLIVEANDNKILHSGMQALGISFSKAINRLKTLKGQVYKHRYHFRTLKTRREFINALQYVFRNGIKHKRTSSSIDPYNSFIAEALIPADMLKTILNSEFLMRMRIDLCSFLDKGEQFYLKKGELIR